MSNGYAMVIEREIPAKLVARFDCTQEYPPGQYFGHADVHVITHNGLCYREAGEQPSSRFGYRFAISHVGHPHVAVVTYPHDKRRFMCVMDGTCYDLNSGMVSGQVLPVSGKFEDMDLIFWPRWTDCSITILTYSTGEPAAAASISIYELESLPPLGLASSYYELPPEDRRWLGIQYEDPCGCTASEGAHDHFEWTERIIEYAKFTGQNLVVYPLLWYHGPLYPSDIEIADLTEIYVANDRKQYVQWTTHPADWYQSLLNRFDHEGLSFIGSLTLLRLSTLMKSMNIDMKSIVNGADTVNNIMENNRVRGGTGDWTGIHNAINYEQIVAAIPPGEMVRGFQMPKGSKVAYGEANYWKNRGGPIFNPLHPQVQKAILTLIREIGERYRKFPAFRGISINIYASTICWFGNLRIGYDDYTISLFTQETGIRVPGKVGNSRRFGKRARFLLAKHKETWIAWRCAKIKALFCQIRDTLHAIRADYRLIITLWDETVWFPMFGTIGAAHQFGTRQSNYDLYREGGIDMALFNHEPGIVLDLGVGCTRDRGGHPPNATAGVTIKPEHSSMYRDFDFLDEKKNAQFAAIESPGVYHFNCWIESWGKYMWFHPPPDDPNLPQVRLLDGKPVDGMIGCNSLYPADGFWWNSQLRIVPTFLAGEHFLEPFAHALAEWDVDRFTSGGLFLDSAHAALHRRFSRAFALLPKRKFLTVGDSSDPVVVRTLIYANRRYIYAVNRDYYLVQIKIHFDHSKPGSLKDPIQNTQFMVDPAGSLATVLSPYGLNVWIGDEHLNPTGFTISVPSEVQAGIEHRILQARSLLTSIRKVEKNLPGTTELLQTIDRCLATHAYAKLQRILTSYIVRKAEALYRKSSNAG
jgi:hypothetical protein